MVEVSINELCVELNPFDDWNVFSTTGFAVVLLFALISLIGPFFGIIFFKADVLPEVVCINIYCSLLMLKDGFFNVILLLFRRVYGRF